MHKQNTQKIKRSAVLCEKIFYPWNGKKKPQTSLYSPSLVNLNFIKTEDFFF